ncbi:MAG: TlpA family protein disulfide reductase [Ruminococcaceae bacterium]|nr:TlpA family protein disulfide reductase [Oscillospiraceae bacterium]
MKRFFSLFLALIMTFSLVSCGGNKDEDNKETKPEESVEDSDPHENYAPDFKVYDGEGKEVTLHETIGDKPIVINLWGVWCNPCVSELPAFQTIYEEYGDRVEFMMVHSDGGYRVKDSEIAELIDSNSYTFPVYYDLDYSVSAVYSITAFPTSIFIDKNGELVKLHQGMMDADTLRTYLDGLLEG